MVDQNPAFDNAQNRDIRQIAGLSAEKAEILRDAGFENVNEVVKATEDEIAEIDGIGIRIGGRIKMHAEQIFVEEVVDALQEDYSIELLDYENQGSDLYRLRVDCAVRAEDGLSLNYSPNGDSRMHISSIGGSEPFYSITVTMEI